MKLNKTLVTSVVAISLANIGCGDSNKDKNKVAEESTEKPSEKTELKTDKKETEKPQVTAPQSETKVSTEAPKTEQPKESTSTITVVEESKTEQPTATIIENPPSTTVTEGQDQKPEVKVQLDECGLDPSKQNGIKICNFTINSSSTQKSVVLKNYSSSKVQLSGYKLQKQGSSTTIPLGNYSIESSKTLVIKNISYSVATKDIFYLISNRLRKDTCQGDQVQSGKVSCLQN